jgi:hypothetical protein
MDATSTEMGAMPCAMSGFDKGANMSRYTDNGYTDRADYLDTLAGEYGLPRNQIWILAQTLGPSEDFDGLVTALEDLIEEEERAQLWASATEGGRA